MRDVFGEISSFSMIGLRARGHDDDRMDGWMDGWKKKSVWFRSRLFSISRRDDGLGLVRLGGRTRLWGCVLYLLEASFESASEGRWTTLKLPSRTEWRRY